MRVLDAAVSGLIDPIAWLEQLSPAAPGRTAHRGESVDASASDHKMQMHLSARLTHLEDSVSRFVRWTNWRTSPDWRTAPIRA